MAYKKVILVNNEKALFTLSFLILDRCRKAESLP